MSDVTSILEKFNASEDPRVAEELLTAVYNELRMIARSKMSQESDGHTLQATVLVHDAWLKLFPPGINPKFNGRAHFFGTAAKVMHRVLVDHIRRKQAIKRGGNYKKTELSDTEFGELVHEAPDEVILAVHEALKKFAETDKATANLIEMRFFGGASMQYAAKELGISLRSAERDFAYFAAWFRREYGSEMNIGINEDMIWK